MLAAGMQVYSAGYEVNDNDLQVANLIFQI